MKQRQDENHTQVQSLERLKEKKILRRADKKLMCARISEAGEDIESVLRSDAGGIGLFRSEFIYMENGPKLPTEEQQFQVYRLAAEAMGMKKVVIRTADLAVKRQSRGVWIWEKRIIRRWDTGESVCHWIKTRYSRRSYVQFYVHPLMERCRIMF